MENKNDAPTLSGSLMTVGAFFAACLLNLGAPARWSDNLYITSIILSFALMFLGMVLSKKTRKDDGANH